MWWVPLIGAGMGLIQGKKQEEQQRRQMKMDAQHMRGAPLYGQAPRRGNAQITPASNAAMQGAMAGAQFAALNKDLWSDDGDNKGFTYDEPIGPQPQAAGWTYPNPIGPVNNVGPMVSGDMYARQLQRR